MKHVIMEDLLRKHILQHHCEKCGECMETLELKGSQVRRSLRRLLKDDDIPVLLDFLTNNRKISIINLSYNNISNDGFKKLMDHALLHTGIDELYIKNNNITEEGVEYMLEIAENLRIKILQLSGNKFGVEGSKKLALFLLKNPHLSRLDAAEVDQTASSLMYFISALSTDQESSNKGLKSLDISRPNPGKMYYLDSEHLAGRIGLTLKYNCYLLELRLQKYGFSCHDIECMMSNASFNNTLRLLDLACNNIGDHGVEQISNWLLKKPALQTLIICRNIITDYGGRSLSFAMPFSKLKSIDISHNKITDDGAVDILNSIKKSPLLRHLRMFGNCIGYETAKIVERMLLSKVLTQENIDIKPYRIDENLHIAEFTMNHINKQCFIAKSQVPTFKKSRFHYSRSFLIESAISVDSRSSDNCYLEDCDCFHCSQCEENEYEESLEESKDEDDYISCICNVETTNTLSQNSKEIDLKSTSYTNIYSEQIKSILPRVASKTRKNILRWINIDEKILDEDLSAAESNLCDCKFEVKEEVEDLRKESAVSCNCSWTPINIPMLLKYLEGVPIEVLLVTQKED